MEVTATTADYIVEFPRLSTLFLENLPEFTKFCSNGGIIKWLALKLLRVLECPKIETSTLGMVDRSILKSTEEIDCNPRENEDSMSNITNLDELLVSTLPHNFLQIKFKYNFLFVYCHLFYYEHDMFQLFFLIVI